MSGFVCARARPPIPPRVCARTHTRGWGSLRAHEHTPRHEGDMKATKPGDAHQHPQPGPVKLDRAGADWAGYGLTAPPPSGKGRECRARGQELAMTVADRHGLARMGG